MCGSHRSTLAVVTYNSIHFILKSVSPTSLEFTSSARLPDQLARSVHTHLLSTRNPRICHHVQVLILSIFCHMYLCPSFYAGAGDLNWDPQVCPSGAFTCGIISPATSVLLVVSLGPNSILMFIQQELH